MNVKHNRYFYTLLRFKHSNLVQDTEWQIKTLFKTILIIKIVEVFYDIT